MSKKIQTKTKTRTSTATLVATALIAGAGLAAAAGLGALPGGSPQLLVRMTPGQPRNTDVMRGGEDVALLSFDLQPRGGNATVDQMTFSVFGDLDADFASIDRDADPEDRFMECTLTDTSGAVVAGPEPVANGYLTFGDPFTVTTARVSTYVVRCDLSNMETTDGNADQFAASIGGEPGVTASIGGTALSGANLIIGRTAYDTLNEVGGISIRVQNEGRLTANLSSDSPESDIVLGNSLNVEIGRWELHAYGEDMFVEMLSFDDMDDDTAVATATLRYVSQDGSEHSSTQIVSAGRVEFQNLDCYVRDGEAAVVSLSVDTETVGAGNVASGDTFQYALNAVDSRSFEAFGGTTGAGYDETDLAVMVLADEMVLRKSEPSFSLASGSPSGSGVPGLDEVFRFNVAADSHGFVTVNKLLFRVTSTDDGATGWNACGDGAAKPAFADAELWSLYDMDDVSTAISDDADWTFLTADGSACGYGTEPVAYALLDLAGSMAEGPVEISAGETRALLIKIDTTGASASNDDSIQLELADGETATSVGQNAIHWDDDVEAFDINENFIESMPVTGGTITY